MDGGDGNLRPKGDSHPAEGTWGWNWHLVQKLFNEAFIWQLEFALNVHGFFFPARECYCVPVIAGLGGSTSPSLTRT